MKIETIKAIKDAFSQRDGVTIEKIKTNDMVNTITSYKDVDEVVFVKENFSGGSYVAFDLHDEDVQEKIDEYAKNNNFKESLIAC